MLTLIRAGATLLLGVFAGGVLFVAIAPSVRALPAPAYVRYWQAVNHDYGRAAPPILLTCLALLVVAAVLSRRPGGAPLVLTLVAATLVVAMIVLTVTRMEPLNVLADGWDPDRPPADFEVLRDRWWRLHHVRTGIALAAFACLLAVPVVAHRQPAAPAPAADRIAAR